MRKAFSIILFAVLVAANVTAQSGRRNINPPPPSAPVVESPVYSQPERAPAASEAPALRALPDDLLDEPSDRAFLKDDLVPGDDDLLAALG